MYPADFKSLHHKIANRPLFEFLNFIPANKDRSVNGGVQC